MLTILLAIAAVVILVLCVLRAIAWCKLIESKMRGEDEEW